MINNNSIPKYVQIYTYLEGLIKRGRIKVGDQLPTEEKIAADFKVNRMTVRQAIDEFVVKKMVVRERGRGSFLVRNSPEEYVWHFNNITSFTDSMLDAGIKSETENMQIDVFDADDRVCDLLGLDEGDRKVIHTLRGKYAENEMVCYERSFLPYNGVIFLLKFFIHASGGTNLNSRLNPGNIYTKKKVLNFRFSTFYFYKLPDYFPEAFVK